MLGRSSEVRVSRSEIMLGGTPTEKTLKKFLQGIPGVDTVGAEARAATFQTRSIKTSSKAWGLDKVLSMIDLTTLEGADTPGKVRTLARKAVSPDPMDLSCRSAAAVCVYGDMVEEAISALGEHHVRQRQPSVRRVHHHKFRCATGSVRNRRKAKCVC